MKYYSRKIEPLIAKYLKIFPAIGIIGPRQTGKSTTLKTIFPKYTYVTFDDPLEIEHFEEDPKGFMVKYADKVIFDEVQRVPKIFNYIKIAVDNDRDNYGKFILTGSSQFHIQKSISETLAGRIGTISLLPFQYSEMPQNLHKEQLLKGGYPELIKRAYSESQSWYADYLRNYVERDVRNISNIGNLNDFQKLIHLLAVNIAQELNMNRLARDIGVTVRTIQNWISILEASYIIFLLQPYHDNLGKRIIKRPKVFFYDSGIVSYLTAIRTREILEKGPLAGALFENYVIAEIKKSVLHTNQDIGLYYFRDNHGLEADLIVEDREKMIITVYEIKSGATIKHQMHEQLNKIVNLARSNNKSTFKYYGKFIYSGITDHAHPEGITCENVYSLLKNI